MWLIDRSQAGIPSLCCQLFGGPGLRKLVNILKQEIYILNHEPLYLCEFYPPENYAFSVNFKTEAEKIAKNHPFEIWIEPSSAQTVYPYMPLRLLWKVSLRLSLIVALRIDRG